MTSFSLFIYNIYPGNSDRTLEMQFFIIYYIERQDKISEFNKKINKKKDKNKPQLFILYTPLASKSNLIFFSKPPATTQKKLNSTIVVRGTKEIN